LINITEVDFPSVVGGQYIYRGTYRTEADNNRSGIICVRPVRINGKNMVFTSTASGGGMQYHFHEFVNKMQKPYFLEGKWFEIS